MPSICRQRLGPEPGGSQTKRGHLSRSMITFWKAFRERNPNAVSAGFTSIVAPRGTVRSRNRLENCPGRGDWVPSSAVPRRPLVSVLVSVVAVYRRPRASGRSFRKRKR
jgi:hypothetical protein